MAAQELSPTAQKVEAFLSGSARTHLDNFLRQESSREVEANGLTPTNYDIFAVRRNDQVGSEVFGPKNLHVGTYSEEALYGASGSPLARFRSAIQTLRFRAEAAASMIPDEVEYGHQVAMVWAEIGRLKEFIGISSPISEIVAELRTARFQFLGKDTPVSTARAVASALGLITDAKRFDTVLADRVVKTLEGGGIDSLAPDALRNLDG